MVRASQSLLIVILLLLASIFAIASQGQQPDTTSLGNFPPLKSETLEKQVVQLPQDFQGERNLLFIAFERKQQKDIDTWLAQMKRYEDLDKGFRYYEIPTIDKMNRFTRWFINTGMRNGIPDKKARERTITLYIDKEPFKRSLQIPDEKKIYGMVVDRSGNVLWRATGGYDEAKGKSLQEFLEKAAVARPTSVPASPEMGVLLCCAAGLGPGANAPSVDHSLDGIGQLQKPKYVSLTSAERWHRYWKDTLLSPGLYFASAGAALGDQASNSPKEWGGGWSGYGRRTGSLYGLFLSQETIHQSGAAFFHTDPRYFRCMCRGGWHRSWHAIEWSFLTYNGSGRTVFDFPQLVGAYGSGMISRTWYPSRYSPLVQGVQAGHMQVGFVVGVHLIQEFSPEIKKVFTHRK